MEHTLGFYEKKFYTLLKELTRFQNLDLTKEERESNIDVNEVMKSIGRAILQIIKV